MGFPLKALAVLAIPMIVLSWIIMVLINTITVSYAVLPVFRHFEDPDVLIERKTHWENIAPKDTLEHLVWILQITDLHISEYHDPGRISQLEKFCTETIDAVRPSVVIASGDLTDAKTLENFGSRQSEWEWKEYSRILRSTRVTDKTTWLDIRGNHDTFNVPSRSSKLNYFRTHSSRGNFTSYHHVHRYGTDSVSFIAVDACPDPGFRRPFNFFGVLTEDDMRQLGVFADESKKSNITVWFGHYPTAFISSADPGLTNIMSGGIAYLSGHLHTLGGLLPELYAMQKSGTLELELGDWKDNRLFRLLAIDHDLLSFSDNGYDDWPLILITNPKNVRYYAPVHEPLDRISRSTHVRVLAFSPSGIQSVRIQLPGTETWTDAARVGNSPLFVLPWDPSKYAIGSHTIRVTGKDTRGRTKEISQEFVTRDAQVPSFSMMRRLILMGDVGKFCSTVTIGIALANTFVMVMFGTKASRKFQSMMVNQFGKEAMAGNVVRELNEVLSIPWVFWTLICCTGYTITMPWFFGEIIEGSYGLVFSFGIWMDRQWLQGQMTYMYAATHLLLHVTPLTWCTILYVRSKLKHPRRRIRRVFYHMIFLYVILAQLFSLRIFSDSYGVISVVTNGLLVWSGLVPTLFLWWNSWNLNRENRLPGDTK